MNIQHTHDWRTCSYCNIVCPQCEKVGTSDQLGHNPDCTACKGECPPRDFWYGSATSKKLVTIGLSDSSSEGWYYCAGTQTFETGLRNAQQKIKRTKYQWVKDHKVSFPFYCQMYTHVIDTLRAQARRSDIPLGCLDIPTTPRTGMRSCDLPVKRDPYVCASDSPTAHTRSYIVTYHRSTFCSSFS
jgi:hypothetical protein